MGVYDIQGKNCVFQLKVDDIYKTVVCAKSFTFNPVTDMKETTTVGSGFWKEFRPRKLSYTITFNGMFQVESLVSQEKIKTMFDYQLGFLPLPYRLIYTDNSGNIMAVDGWVYVTSTLLDASPVNLVNGTIELQGNGPIQLSDVIPDLANINIVSLGDSAVNAVFQFKLFNANGDIVFDSGQLPEASGGNLTHPVNVTGQVQKGTYSIFWQALSQSNGNAFELNAPPTKSELFENTLVSESTFDIQEYDFTANRAVTFTLGVINPPPACVPPVILVTLNNKNGKEGYLYTGIVTVGGSEPFNLTNITKPAWLGISILSGGIISLQGYPTEGNGQVVSFDINNACGSVPFSDTIDIEQNTDLVPINWDYTEEGGLAAAGIFSIYRNSIQIVNQGSSGSGTEMVNPADAIEIRVNGIGGSVLKEIDVVNTDGPVTSVSGTNSIETVYFSIVADKVYDVTASKVNV